ncbi:MAG: Ger(x)C family spore germination protein [Bacillota bacterium]|nr:Ger(x)C family spore germination protein [Bacillota bacterium]
MSKIKVAIAMVIIILVMPLSGCWDQQEITNLASVVGMGFDLAKEPHMVRVSVQISPPSPASAAGGTGGGTLLRVITIEVESPAAFLTLLQGHTRHEPFFRHLGFIIFGEEFARQQGIGRVLAGLQGLVEVRGIVPILVSVGSAEEVLKARSGIGRTPGQDIQDILSNLTNAPLGRTVTLNDAFTVLSNLGMELSLPILELTPLRLEVGDQGPATGTGQNGEQLQEVILTRMALFNRDKWVTDLDSSITQLFVLLTGDVRKGSITIPIPGQGEGFIALQYDDFRPQFSTTVNGEEVALMIEIKIGSRVLDVTGGEYDFRTLGMEPISQALAQVINSQVHTFMNKLQLEGLDSLGVGQTISRNQPKAWSRLEPRWNEIYPEVSIKVSTDANIITTGLIGKFFKVRR